MKNRTWLLAIVLVGAMNGLYGCQSESAPAPPPPGATPETKAASTAKIPDGATGTAADTFVKPGGK